MSASCKCKTSVGNIFQLLFAITKRKYLYFILKRYSEECDCIAMRALVYKFEVRIKLTSNCRCCSFTICFAFLVVQQSAYN